MAISSSIPPMNKNVLLVLVVILTPIVILGVLAMAGAENFEEQKEAAEHEETENATEAAAGMMPVEDLESVSSPFYMSPLALECLTA
jgi:heme/copper-type cytochrome/quinol oxidase subunit 2